MVPQELKSRIEWQHLQYRRERELYLRISRQLEALKKQYREFSDKTHLQEREFFRQLSSSIKIDRLQPITTLIKRLKTRFNTSWVVHIFSIQSPVALACCFPKYGPRRTQEPKEVIFLVSQHFLNDLEDEEQISILGHEFGHVMFGHVHIPAKIILQAPIPLKDANHIKMDTLKWMTCSELTCDMIGLAACNANVDAFCSAMLKFSTGLSGATVTRLSSTSDLKTLILGQFDELADSVINSNFSTHPLTPLRIKTAQTIADCALFKFFGKVCSQNEIRRYINELNSRIDKQTKHVYPELVESYRDSTKKETFFACVAVALADGSLSISEIQAISRIVNSQLNTDTIYRDIRRRLATETYDQLSKALMAKSVERIKNQKLVKSEVAGIVRQLITVAASDNNISMTELHAIHDFGSKFGINKKDIVILIEQMNLREKVI